MAEDNETLFEHIDMDMAADKLRSELPDYFDVNNNNDRHLYVTVNSEDLSKFSAPEEFGATAVNDDDLPDGFEIHRADLAHREDGVRMALFVAPKINE